MTDREPGAPDDELPADDTYGGLFQDDPPADEAHQDADAENGDEAEARRDRRRRPRRGGRRSRLRGRRRRRRGRSRRRGGGRGGPRRRSARGGTSTRPTAVRAVRAAGQSVAERAVHLRTAPRRSSCWPSSPTFVGILLYGMLAGSAGFFTPLRDPQQTRPRSRSRPTPSRPPPRRRSPFGVAVRLAGCLGFGRALGFAVCRALEGRPHRGRPRPRRPRLPLPVGLAVALRPLSRTRSGAGPRRYTRPAMTHVFVAPHPDDVALSCGGLIASLRELGQNVAILTVFSGDGASGRPDAVPARGARLRVEGDLAGDRGVQPVQHPERLPGPSRARTTRSRRGRPRRTGWTRRRPTPTRPPSASGSARRGTAGRRSTTRRWPASRSWTTSRTRAPS